MCYLVLSKRLSWEIHHNSKPIPDISDSPTNNGLTDIIQYKQITKEFLIFEAKREKSKRNQVESAGMFGLKKTHTLSLSFHIHSPSFPMIQSILGVVRSIPVFEYISTEMRITESKGWTTVRTSSMNFQTREGVLDALQTYGDRTKKETEPELQWMRKIQTIPANWTMKGCIKICDVRTC